MDVFLRRQLRAMGTEYASLKKELKASLSTIFEKYADADGRVNYAELSKYGRLDKFRDEVKSVTSRYQTRIDNKIRGTSVDMYTKGYQGEMLKVKAIAPDVKLQTIPPIQFTTAAVQNDLSGMVLNERLREHRADIIRRINVDLTQGIHRGDTYGTMAKSISEVLEKDFVKSTRIARTEGHRVYEQARNDAVKRVSEKTKHKMMKRWVSSKDERVRDSHIEMDGQEVPVDEDFVNPVTGGKGPHPGAMGTAEDDINCRCTMVTYVVASDDVPEPIKDIDDVNYYDTAESPDEYSTTAGQREINMYLDTGNEVEYLDMSEEVKHAFTEYKGDAYQDINGLLRGKSDIIAELAEDNRTSYIKDQIAAMDSWFSSSALTTQPQGNTAWRGITHTQADRLMANKVCIDPGFMSTSTDPSFAKNFAYLGRGKEHRMTRNMIRVHIPEGEPIVVFRSESEILLGRGKELRLIAVENIPPEGALNMGIYEGVRILHCVLR
jgi:hypothetical protein